MAAALPATVTRPPEAATMSRSGSMPGMISVATKPSRLVDPGEPVVLTGPGRLFASRGGEKLDPVLDRLGIAVAGRRCPSRKAVHPCCRSLA